MRGLTVVSGHQQRQRKVYNCVNDLVRTKLKSFNSFHCLHAANRWPSIAAFPAEGFDMFLSCLRPKGQLVVEFLAIVYSRRSDSKLIILRVRV